MDLDVFIDVLIFTLSLCTCVSMNAQDSGENLPVVLPCNTEPSGAFYRTSCTHEETTECRLLPHSAYIIRHWDRCVGTLPLPKRVSRSRYLGARLWPQGSEMCLKTVVLKRRYRFSRRRPKTLKFTSSKILNNSTWNTNTYPRTYSNSDDITILY